MTQTTSAPTVTPAATPATTPASTPAASIQTTVATTNIQTAATLTTNVTAEIHHVPTDDVDTTPLVPPSTVQSSAAISVPLSSAPSGSSSTQGGLSVTATQLMASGISAVGGPQQIVNMDGQNVLVSGSSPSTIGGLSI